MYPHFNPHSTLEERRKYGKVLKAHAEAVDDGSVEHLDYVPERGQWRFRVAHFSRWGLKAMKEKKRKAAAAAAAKKQQQAEEQVHKKRRQQAAEEEDDDEDEEDEAEEEGRHASDAQARRAAGSSRRADRGGGVMPSASNMFDDHDAAMVDEDDGSDQQERDDDDSPSAAASRRPHLAKQLGLEPERVHGLRDSLFPDTGAQAGGGAHPAMAAPRGQTAAAAAAAAMGSRLVVAGTSARRTQWTKAPAGTSGPSELHQYHHRDPAAVRASAHAGSMVLAAASAGAATGGASRGAVHEEPIVIAAPHVPKRKSVASSEDGQMLNLMPGLPPPRGADVPPASTSFGLQQHAERARFRSTTC